jgi:hypothetical protein
MSGVLSALSDHPQIAGFPAARIVNSKRIESVFDFTVVLADMGTSSGQRGDLNVT